VVRLELPENVVLQVLLRVTIGTRKTPLGKVSAKEVHQSTHLVLLDPPRIGL